MNDLKALRQRREELQAKLKADAAADLAGVEAALQKHDCNLQELCAGIVKNWIAPGANVCAKIQTLRAVQRQLRQLITDLDGQILSATRSFPPVRKFIVAPIVAAAGAEKYIDSGLTGAAGGVHSFLDRELTNCASFSEREVYDSLQGALSAVVQKFSKRVDDAVVARVSQSLPGMIDGAIADIQQNVQRHEAALAAEEERRIRSGKPTREEELAEERRLRAEATARMAAQDQKAKVS